jgi:hypothetical protein
MSRKRSTVAAPRDLTVNPFRARRAAILRSQIDALIARFGRPINILDVGGRADYWHNTCLDGIASVTLLNRANDPLAYGVEEPECCVHEVGDARDLTQYDDESVDLVHSNSVIEHVGLWDDMAAMARETRRVGRSGWIQTPAFEFPIEPHFRAPCLHWFGAPLRRRLLTWSIEPYFRRNSFDDRRRYVDSVNLLSRREVEALFAGCEIYVERFGLPKSYTARWMPV